MQPILGSHDIFLYGGCTDAVAAHEILHALGRYHEHSRPDRDEYVIIHEENYENGKLIILHDSSKSKTKYIMHIAIAIAPSSIKQNCVIINSV